MSLAGAGYGAAAALEQILAEALQREELAQRQQQAEAVLKQRQTEATAANEDRDADRDLRGREINLRELQRRDDSNKQGLELMNQDRARMDTDTAVQALPPHLRHLGPLMTAGFVRGVSADDMESPQDREAREIRVRQASQQPRERKPEWVTQADGSVIDINGVAPAGSRPFDEVADRQKARSQSIHPQVLDYSRGVIRKIDDLIGRDDDPNTPENEQKPNRITGATAGVGGRIRRWSPFNNSAKDVDAELFSLSSELAISALQKMRASSQTGGAVGNVALGEMEIMKNAEAAIRSDQSPANLRRQLNIIRESEQRFLDAAEGGSSGSDSPAPPSGGAAPRRLRFDKTGKPIP